ncbi:hypothetical protein H0H92_009381 [Tricholoma furcatifolium]|nr:hypothetical protein H0H92_009381 [Tricholoma furcatifolium]
MFKKPLAALKTSAPLRSSDRRKLKQRVVSSFGISSEDGDLLVPDGIQSIKFTTHLEEQGVAYLAPDGDPLWFTLGKGSDDLIPTTYTLWKRRDLLPVISTPPAVIPILVGGADLMIPGVVHHSPLLKQDQLVSILQYNHSREAPMLSPPLAVGRMALSGDQLGEDQEKGKAVYVLHTWKDHLWEMGAKGDVPESVPFNSTPANTAPENPDETTKEDVESTVADGIANLTIQASEPSEAAGPSYNAQEISTLLHTSLIQVIASTIPPSAFPIPATLFYTNYILPSRPAYPARIIPHSGPTPVEASPCPSASEITIKSSTHKSLTTFLKSEEKAGLITTKAPQKHSNQTDLLITAVSAKHPSVTGHQPYVTLETIAKKAKKIEDKAREQASATTEVSVTELWKPHLETAALFERMDVEYVHPNFHFHYKGLSYHSTSKQYELPQIKALLNTYITKNSLVNLHDQAYINLDESLINCLSTKAKGKGKDDDVPMENLEFMRRDELIKAIVMRMQHWYEVSDGKEAVKKKGELKPIQVAMKVRQGRKVSTLISGFEPFLVINADGMAEDLRVLCAGATSVAPIPGKAAGSGMEVLVQGKQSRAVLEYLTGKGIPKKWIEVHDLPGRK